MEHIQNTTNYSSKVHADITKQIIEAFKQEADISGKIIGKRKIEQGSKLSLKSKHVFFSELV